MPMGNNLQRRGRMRFLAFGMMLTLLFLAHRVEAAIAWRYVVSGQLVPGAVDPHAIRLSGVLTTTGNVADLGMPNSFSLESIESFEVNGIDLTRRRFWIGAGGLPFASGVTGAIGWDGSSGIIDSDVSQSMSAGLYPPPLQSKRITFSVPSMTSTATGLVDEAREELGWEYQVSEIRFVTMSAHFSPVPEPSSQFLSMIAVVGLYLIRRNRCRGAMGERASTTSPQQGGQK